MRGSSQRVQTPYGRESACVDHEAGTLTVPAGLRQTVIASRAKDFGSVQVNDEPPAGFDARPHNCHKPVDVLARAPYERHSSGPAKEIDEPFFQVGFCREVPNNSANRCAFHQQNIDAFRRVLDKSLQ